MHSQWIRRRLTLIGTMTVRLGVIWKPLWWTSPVPPRLATWSTGVQAVVLAVEWPARTGNSSCCLFPVFEKPRWLNDECFFHSLLLFVCGVFFPCLLFYFVFWADFCYLWINVFIIHTFIHSWWFFLLHCFLILCAWLCNTVRCDVLIRKFSWWFVGLFHDSVDT